MMRQHIRQVVCAALLWLCAAATLQAQDFKINKFEENMLDLTAARAAVKDRNGEECALIKFSVRDLGFEFEPNMGVVRKEQRVGETWLYVPAKTKRITIRHPQLGILRDYNIPVDIEKKVVYEADIEITNEDYLRAKRQAERAFHMNLGVGFNVMSIMGPSAYLGFNYKNHGVEAGVTIGMSKVQDISFYQADNAAFWGTYDYKPLRVFARYGYAVEAGPVLLIPQVGAAFTNINGAEIRRAANGGNIFSKAHAVSATVGCRVNYRLGKMLRLQLTPEYDLSVKKSQGFTILREADSKIKSWADGLNINAGVALQF